MDSSASHPPGFSHRLGLEGSPAPASPESSRRYDHVSGLGLSSASSWESVAPRQVVREHAPPEVRPRAKDRLGWELPKPSKGRLWSRRIEVRNEAGASGWGASPPEMSGLCFRCFLPGHRKRDCTNAEVAGERKAGKANRARCEAAFSAPSASTAPTLVTAPSSTSPPPPAASRLPPMEAWPPLAVEQPSVVVREGSLEEVAGQPLLCVVRRTAAMCDLERRLRFAMVASIGGRRPAVSCEQVLVALRWRGVPEGTVSVHAFAPEDFLVVFE
ncbi:hypothetical protein QYE76_007795 [Lolium multiflorum]|uniref:CCHC-type domain-containing protein n=1 Tax=Lolium multiflorum TaxID=4521 RepID=A0AAD8PKZ5_LOLMU|nr:hypothetical protein QYE76_017778 [Lolium multiflorum]KAK1569600.1 hypothetical protein QYE76_007795 [Lolium multiflorum]